MEEDEAPRGGYKEALLSAAGKRQRSKAHTGLTPPALQQWTKEADAASTTPRDAINTNVLQEPYVEHGTSCGFRSNVMLTTTTTVTVISSREHSQMILSHRTLN